MSFIATDFYSDHDMACPGGWYGGFKEGRVQRFGESERSLSDIFTGDWHGSTFNLVILDHDRSIRERLASTVDRYWSQPLTVRMTTRENRAALGVPYTVFVGPIIHAKPIRPLAWEITLGDIVSQRLLSDQMQIPWRIIRDGFLSELSTVSEQLDLDRPEPIIYGANHRMSTDEDAPIGYEFTPILLGTEDVDGSAYYVWLVCGHAVKDVVALRTVDADGVHVDVLGDEGTDWLVPHYSGHDTAFGAAYQDRRSDTFGNMRRYTLIYGLVGADNPDQCADGTLTLTCGVEGVETIGDGSGDMIQDRLQQYKHFLINFVAHAGPDSYQGPTDANPTGAWLTTPQWSLFDGDVDIVDEASFADCAQIAVERLPAFTGQTYQAGYVGAGIIGATSSDRSSVKRWIADWNRSCAVRFGITHFGQIRVVMLHPTDALKAAAPLYTDAFEILDGSFQTDVQWGKQANRIPFKADYQHTSGNWQVSSVYYDGVAIEDYEREILGEERTYPFAPGIRMSTHLAGLELLISRHPPRVITFEATVGPNPVTADSLGYNDLGDYIRYQHYAAVSDDVAEVRMAQIVRHQVQAGSRRVLIEAIDCEDLIDYESEILGDELETFNDTCATALEIASETGPQVWHINTDGHGTDPNILGIAASPPDWSGTLAYHAAWWQGTAPLDATRLFLTTVHSGYDTQMAVFTGTCGSPPSMTEVAFNDDDTGYGTTTSVLDIPITPGTQYWVLVAGRRPTDGGSLSFGAYFYDPAAL